MMTVPFSVPIHALQMLKVEELYQVKISNRSAALEDLADIFIRAWESIAGNTKIATNEHK
jgi:hypothetical protein